MLFQFRIEELPGSVCLMGDADAKAAAHAGFLSPSFLMRETNVLGLMLSSSAAPPGP